MRAFDLFVGTAALVALAPLMTVLAVAIKVTSPGPIIFRHRRIGRDGVEFECLKFRSMRQDAEAQLQRLLASDEALRREFEETFKLRNDPRVTRIGRVLRATSLDELPQLLNVLRGEMSVVGPRPIVRKELERFGDALPSVLSVKPGMTGLWQVSGRSDLSYEDRVALDVQYASTRTLAGDLRICVRTAARLLRDNGAY